MSCADSWNRMVSQFSKMGALRAILPSFGFSKKQKNTPKSDFLYGLLKDSEYTLETARAERLSAI